MKERMTITVEKDIYDMLQALPRRVSLSEVISWIVKATLEDIKAGRELSSKELQDWMDSTPEGEDFRERLTEHWGPGIRKVEAAVSKVTKAAGLGKKDKGKGK